MGAPKPKDRDYGTGLFVNSDYLVTGEVQKIRENGATAGIGVLATYAYDNLSNRTSATFGNGTSSSFSYDPVSRLASLTNNLSGTANDVTIGTMAYNPASQITSQPRSNDAYAYTAHPPASIASVANGLNQVTSAGGVGATYDAKGNLTLDPVSAKTYGYSSENLLTSASGGVTLSYDPMLRLYQMAGASTTRIAYDGLDAIAEYDGSNVLQSRTVFGPAMDEPIVQYNAAGARAWFTADERGSIVAIVNDSGMTRINTYDEYGKPGSGNIGRYQYTGQMWLPEAGLYYYKARMYSAQLGRFVQPDPIGFADSPNLYNYVLGDPLNYVDPLGLAGCPPDTWVCGARLPTLSTHDLESAQKPSLAEPNNTGEGGGDIVVTGRRLRQKKVSQCMINFIASQGYNTSGLENVTFYKGSLTAQSVYNTMGNPAITIGNSIHVASAAWRGISSPSGGAAYFEEIIHTRQYQSWGMMGFGAAYGVASAMGKVRGYNMSGFIFGDAHDNPVEQQAIAMSVGLLKAYNALPVSKRCSD